MNRGVLVIVAALLAVALTVVLVLRRPRAVPEDAPVPAPAPETTAAVPAPPASPAAPGNTPRAARPRPEPAADAPPAPAPPPLETAPDVATLRIDSDVAGAQVFVDRQFVGVTPLTVENVKPGSHQLNASVEGFDGLVDTIDVTPGNREFQFRFREVKLDSSIPVVHKHRLGSCRGALAATVEGLRYDTTDKNDGFRVALTDMETFDVDYLARTLRVKIRSGKSYTFTDPDGNADHLLVFQRDVERARERLRTGDSGR